MSVQKIIQESLNKNPLGVKEALEEAIQDRIAIALEEKMNNSVELDEAKSVEESASKYGVDTGPLMKANAWIKPAKLSKMIEALRDEGEYKNFAIGRLEKPSGKSSQVAISVNDSNPNQYFKKGMNKPHTFYYDTGRGYRQTEEEIIITGMVTVGKEGEPKTTGKVNMNERTALMVFK